MKHIIRSTVSAGVMLAILGLTNARADQIIVQEFNQPIHTTVNIDESGCQNHPGPNITLRGEIALGGLQLRLLLENNLKGTHQVETNLDAKLVIVPLGTSITIPKQPVLGGVGGNPYIWIQFSNKKGVLSDEIFLGRCVQGLSLGNDFLNDSIASILLQILDCNNKGGPFINIGESTVKMSGLNATLIFRNNLKGTHTAEAQTTVGLISDGFPLTIPKQPPLGGAGGNPIIGIQLLQGNGDAITDLMILGRCNKL